MTAIPLGRGWRPALPRFGILLGTSVLAAAAVALLLELLLPHSSWEVAGALAACIAVTAAWSGRDVGLGLIVPHVVARRGPLLAAAAFGLAIGSGAARQHRGYWAAAVLAGSLVHDAIPVLIAYATVRLLAPLIIWRCGTLDCVRRQIERLTGQRPFRRNALLLANSICISILMSSSVLK